MCLNARAVNGGNGTMKMTDISLRKLTSAAIAGA
jgi:hypothetical protein